MAGVALQTQWSMTFSSTELALIRRMLRGDERPGDLANGKILEAEITGKMLTQFKTLHEGAEKLRKNVEER